LTWKLASYALAAALFVGAFLVTRLPVLSVTPEPQAQVTPASGEPAAVPPAPYQPEAPPAGLVLPALDLTSQPLAEAAQVDRDANLDTSIPTRGRVTIEHYTVQQGDTIFGIAAKFNLKPETILWGNPELVDSLNLLRPGKVLNILPIEGALRVVQTGDTLENIAETFHSTPEAIVAFVGNDLDPENPVLTPGQNIVIPDGWRDTIQWQLPVASRNTTRGPGASGEPGSCAGPLSGPTGGFNFIWPANNRYLSGWDYNPNTHPGLDIAAGLGAPIYASETGVVVFSGLSIRGYGNLVIIDHGNGWQTAYAHLSQIYFGCGQAIAQGVVLGLAGSTGNSTGPHLHYEMRSSEYGRVNPWQFLP
jgi:murein DD-endopeptidase MepM/ murein hydrolase activator NlpD